MNNLLRRCNKVAFYSIKNGDSTEYHRMKGFTDFTVSKNPSEYSRKYVDEAFEQSDVVGYSPSVSFSFDYIKDNKVHDDIESISRNELVGDDAVRSIVIVDTTYTDGLGNYAAVKRDFSVVVDTEGSGTETYQISGTFKSKSAPVPGFATREEGLEKVSFTTSTIPLLPDDGIGANPPEVDEDEL